MARDSYAARVRRGVDFLDNTVNDEWYMKIDLDSLNLEDGEHCVLGQLWQDKLDPDAWPDDAFGEAKRTLGVGDRDGELGFNLDDADHGDWGVYRWLTIRWRQAIREKRAAHQ